MTLPFSAQPLLLIFGLVYLRTWNINKRCTHPHLSDPWLAHMHDGSWWDDKLCVTPFDLCAHSCTPPTCTHTNTQSPSEPQPRRRSGAHCVCHRQEVELVCAGNSRDKHVAGRERTDATRQRRGGVKRGGLWGKITAEQCDICQASLVLSQRTFVELWQ